MPRPDSQTHLLDRGGDLVAGRYRIQQLLGVGAMGSVWIAEQVAIKQEVVVKFHEEAFVGSESTTALKRFLREARMLGAVHHRNVTKLYEAGTNERGEPYLILERLRGRSLAARMREVGILPLTEALEVAIAIADGLDAVHRAGVLHRDIKPENVFLHEDDEEGTVPKLLDFGLARSQSGGASITMNGKTVGTPGYMAPEQARGRRDLDGRVDVYSLSVTLYEALTGELPSRGATAGDRLIWTATKDPVPLTVHRPDLEGPLADMLAKGLARRREERFAHGGALRDAIIEAAREAFEDDPVARPRGRPPAETLSEPAPSADPNADG